MQIKKIILIWKSAFHRKWCINTMEKHTCSFNRIRIYKNWLLHLVWHFRVNTQTFRMNDLRHLCRRLASGETCIYLLIFFCSVVTCSLLVVFELLFTLSWQKKKNNEPVKKKRMCVYWFCFIWHLLILMLLFFVFCRMRDESLPKIFSTIFMYMWTILVVIIDTENEIYFS